MADHSGFEAALDRWASASASGSTALSNLGSGLEEFAGAQRRWENRRAALDSMGIETGCVEWRKRISSEEAAGVQQAERSLKRLHEAIGDMQASVTDMWTAASTALDLVGCLDHAQSVQRVPLAEALCICAAAHRDELRLKDAAVRAIGLESSPAEARAMLLAWDAGVFADTHAADAARKALSAAASSGVSAVGASGSQGGKKKKKK